jgi:hypothetical protein
MSLDARRLPSPRPRSPWTAAPSSALRAPLLAPLLALLLLLGSALAQPEPPADQPPAAAEPATPTEESAPPGRPGDAAEPETADPETADPETSDADGLAATLEDGVVIVRRGEQEAWRWRPAPEAGAPSAPLVAEGEVLVGHGLYLLRLAADDGSVRARTALPAPAVELRRGDDGPEVTVAYADGTTRAWPAEDPGGAPVRFGAAAEAFGGLQRAAAALAEPAEAHRRDPTDPWPTLRLALAADDEERRAELLDEALARAAPLPFFESARLALALLDAGEPARFDAAAETALADLAARGYDPRLLSDPALRRAYGLPHDALAAALDAGDLARAQRLAPHAWRLASEQAPETVATLERLASELRAAGERQAAGLWRERARDLRRAGLASWVDGAAGALARLGWAGVVGLLASFALLWLVLLAKVWRAQSLVRRQRRERGQPTRPWTRLWVPRQASTPEKLVLLIVLLLAGVQAALAGWHQNAPPLPDVFRSGTLASPPAAERAEALPERPHAAWVRGLSRAQRGDLDGAREAWRAAGELAPALTNRAVAADDPASREELLERALALDPRDPVARFLAGRAGDPSPFHAEVAPEAPLWSVPSPQELRLALAGDWRAALSAAVTAPWRTLPAARPAGLPAWGWWGLLLVWAALALALAASLLVPRARVARDAPRTPAYHVLALLVPGSGHADELWGLLLLVPFALVGADAWLTWRTGSGPLGLAPAADAAVLAALVAVNLIGFSVELASYRRRMWQLRESKPELARSYGLPPAVRREEA